MQRARGREVQSRAEQTLMRPHDASMQRNPAAQTLPHSAHTSHLDSLTSSVLPLPVAALASLPEGCLSSGCQDSLCLKVPRVGSSGNIQAWGSSLPVIDGCRAVNSPEPLPQWEHLPRHTPAPFTQTAEMSRSSTQWNFA